MALVRHIDGTRVTPVSTGWRCAAFPPGQVDRPGALDGANGRWFDAVVPGTAASALAAAAAWTDEDARDFDAEDWWFRCRVATPPPAGGARTALRFGGLATLADVWLDGVHVLRSGSMFVEHEVDVGSDKAEERELTIRFSSLNEALKARRPRPRWRAQVVSQQQLRWFRTTLFGRIPEWTPPLAPVGPYLPITLETRTFVHVLSADVKPRVEGRDGVCEVRLRLLPLNRTIERIWVQVGDERTELECEQAAEGSVVVARGTARVRDASLWWPFTHGEPVLYAVHVFVRTKDQEIAIDLGRTGFRQIDLRQEGGGFGLRVNGVDVFCRGACWSPLDIVGLGVDARALSGMLGAVRRAGMNMIRVGGTMTYPPAAFFDACDELGILVWQDFMFANMDYPVADEGFATLARAEAVQLMDRVQLSPSLSILCGGSEVEQQAAMLGLPREAWHSPLFDDWLPSAARAWRPDVPYVTSSPTGGALPFRVDTGPSHYYGVGAYRRPVEDARRARVRFTSECLAFANVPGDETIDEFMAGDAAIHGARWKRRVPRDKGSSWDFDDVRDHYVGELFGVDPHHLRMTDAPRYLQLARVATGEAMAATMAEWRRVGSECRGALVWLLRDFWPGAGWGVIDAYGRPKAAYYFLKRALKPATVLITDEGLNGLSLHAINDGPAPLEADIRLVLYRLGEVPVAEGTAPVAVPAHGAVEVFGDSLLGRFTDSTYAYRFAGPGHDVAVATLQERATGERIGEAFFFPRRLPSERHADLGVEASAELLQAGEWLVTVRTKRFAQAVAFDARGFVADDDFFHIEPGGERKVLLRGHGQIASARVVPLNAFAATRITTKSPSG
jgi:beta-mannosidase